MSGVLTGYLSWRWCRYVNVVIAAAAMFGAVVYLSEMRPATRPHVDVIGTVLAGVGLFGIMFGLSQAETDGWGLAVTITALVVGAVLWSGSSASRRGWSIRCGWWPSARPARRSLRSGSPGWRGDRAAIGPAVAGAGLDARMYRDNADILANAR